LVRSALGCDVRHPAQVVDADGRATSGGSSG
jgi:hypothetical protein